MAAKLLGDEYVNQQIILIDFASTPRASVIKCRWDDTFTEVADINDEYTLTSAKITTSANVSGTKEGEIIVYPNNLMLQIGITILKHPEEEMEFTD